MLKNKLKKINENSFKNSNLAVVLGGTCHCGCEARVVKAAASGYGGSFLSNQKVPIFPPSSF